ncbi:MAG: right-handed parallel beta-helix repeat-containing protein, partial [Gemmatimonadetes bacterium]|nr:right-handed parallel beta-helix repeat-containing protein [Gemmatimonadota bacterium]
MFNIKDYGAVGDGVNNDLPAYKAMVAAVNAAGGGDVLFPPGVYFMDGYQRYNEVPATVVEPAFKLCTRLRVSGYGAKIDLRGNYHRSSADDKHPITGLYFWKCKHFVVEGFEIDGNLDQMTRDANMIGETWSYGILTAGCSHYTIRDVDVHHHLTDGVLLGHLPAPNENNDEYALMLNVRSRYNGRQGLSLVGMKHFTAENCDFSYTGRVEPYGGHAPGAGVDIEPEGAGAVAEDILFLNCRFHDNKGGNIGAGYATLTRRVTFRDCLVTYPASRGWEGNEHGVILYSEDGVMDNCYLDLGHRNVYLSHGGPSTVARNTLRNCTIRSSRNGVATLHEAEALVEGCRIISTATAPTGEFPW